MIIGERHNQLIRLPARRVYNGYFIRWYYNGWHYWFFLPGSHITDTVGERYRTVSTRKILLSTGQISLSEAIAIRTILHTREVYLWTNSGWANIRIEPGTLNIYNNMVKGEELEFKAIIGSKEVSYNSGFSPVVQIPEVAPSPLALTDYDGNGYNSVIINGQEWLVENYKTTHYANGSPIPYISDQGAWAADVTGAYCYPEGDPGNKDVYGLLYSGYCVANVNGLAYIKRYGVHEPGWRVPSFADWNGLKNFCGDDPLSLRETGFTHWFDDGINEGTDLYGFKALGISGRDEEGYAYGHIETEYYRDTGHHTFWWRYNSVSLSHVWIENLCRGYSVRLVRDL